MKDTIPNIILALAICFIAFGIAIKITQRYPMPKCQEDAVLVGIGNFYQGRWSSYICGPAVDDYHD